MSDATPADTGVAVPVEEVVKNESPVAVETAGAVAEAVAVPAETGAQLESVSAAAVVDSVKADTNESTSEEAAQQSEQGPQTDAPPAPLSETKDAAPTGAPPSGVEAVAAADVVVSTNAGTDATTNNASAKTSVDDAAEGAMPKAEAEKSAAAVNAGDELKQEKSGAESLKDVSSASDSPRKQQKASFNIDAKPFSPAPIVDPVLQGTMVGDASGISIKVGQWGPQPFMPLPHMSPVAPVSVGLSPFTIAAMPQVPAVRKDSTGGKEALSAFAKPWSPHPEVVVAATVPVAENEVAVHPGSWTTFNLEGKDYQTPSPMVPKEASSNTFVHSYSIHPKGLRSVELELFNYICGRCPLKTLYGRLSSRQPDVTMRNVSMDVPPLCVAHLIEQVTKAKVTALCANDVEGSHYDIWLDKPNMAPVLTDTMSGCVWTCPMHHGYAVLGKGEEGKKYLRNYVERLKDSQPEGSNVFEVALVEVKEH